MLAGGHGHFPVRIAGRLPQTRQHVRAAAVMLVKPGICTVVDRGMLASRPPRANTGRACARAVECYGTHSAAIKWASCQQVTRVTT
jgi:hypothetical protein